MPVFCHTRYFCFSVPIDSQPVYEFGHVKIPSGVVFYRTALSYGFVNIKPVVPGHILLPILIFTVKPVLSNHSKIDKTKVFEQCGSLMQVKSTAECSTKVLHKVLVNRLFKLAQEKVWLGELTFPP